MSMPRSPRGVVSMTYGMSATEVLLPSVYRGGLCDRLRRAFLLARGRARLFGQHAQLIRRVAAGALDQLLNRQVATQARGHAARSFFSTQRAAHLVGLVAIPHRGALDLLFDLCRINLDRLLL